MKYFSIPKPCSEEWNEMTPTEKGAFCQKCSNEVRDVSNMGNEEIIQMMSSERKVPCMRMTSTQERTLNVDLRVLHQSHQKNVQRAFVFSLLVVFGFTLFSCTDSRQIHERNILESIATTMANKASQNLNNWNETDSTELKSIELKNNSQLEAGIEPQEQIEGARLLLGEPVVKEKIIDPVQVEEYKVERVETFTMGVPAIYHESIVPEEQVILDKKDTLREDEGIPTSFATLLYPNPAVNTTTLKVDLPEDTKNLGIRLLDLNGRVLRSINDKSASAGEHEFRIDLQELVPAYYLVDIRYNDKHKVERLSKAQ
ncbi:MAG: T9SS type A sorting domain-containing protein [Fluviicola sp.]